MKNHSIESRALASYFRRGKQLDGQADQPCSGGVSVDYERQRVVIRNSYRVLAVYQYREFARRIVFKPTDAEPADEEW